MNENKKNYSVNDSVWIATAILTYEKFFSINTPKLSDMYFKQGDIKKKAEQYAEKQVNQARISTHCCGDSENASHNYLRSVTLENNSCRRLTGPQEFGGKKTRPYDLVMTDRFAVLDGDITMREILEFVDNEYKRLVDNIIRYPFIKNYVEYILNNYIVAKKRTFSGHEMGTYIRKDVPQNIYKTEIISQDKYRVTGSVGQGNWAMVPWVGIFNRSITETATKGVYIVYLLSKDGNSLYLTFNQGCTELRNNNSKKDTIRIMRENAEKIVNKIDGRGFKSDEEISLGEELTDLAELYQKGTIFYKEYKKDKF